MKLFTDAYDMYIRAQINDIKLFKPGTIGISYFEVNPGIYVSSGLVDGENNYKIYQILFDKSKYTFNTIKKWLLENKGDIWDEQTVNFSKEKEVIIFDKFEDIGKTDKLSKLKDDELINLAKRLNDFWKNIEEYNHKINKNAVIDSFSFVKNELNNRKVDLIDDLQITDAKLKRLDLGCGEIKKEEYEQIDIKDFGYNKKHDLNYGIPESNNSFDIVNADFFLEYVKNEARVRIIEEINRVLKPGGLFIFKSESTDGRGAFQDLETNSLWNENTFRYIAKEFKEFSYSGFKCDMEILDLKTEYNHKYKTAVVSGILRKIK